MLKVARKYKFEILTIYIMPSKYFSNSSINCSNIIKNYKTGNILIIVYIYTQY